MGVGFKTKNHETFSQNIKKGDFITYDKNNDGSWDHIGFVIDKKTGNACYRDNGKTYNYIDYKVAQHTTNYNAWVSSSTNGWEHISDSGATYARVRR